MTKKYSYRASKRFVKNWSKLDPKIKQEVIEKIDLFLENPYLTSLKTHKLTGKLKNYWSFSVSYNLRVMFRFSEEDEVEFIDIGSHEIYRC